MTPEELIAEELAYWVEQYHRIDPTTNTRPRLHSTKRDKVTHYEQGQILGKMTGLAYALDLTRNGEEGFVRHAHYSGEWSKIMNEAIAKSYKAIKEQGGEQQ